MAWFWIILYFGLGVLNAHDAEKAADNGNMAGTLWYGAWAVFFLAALAHNSNAL